MRQWQQFLWSEEASEATVALVPGNARGPLALLEQLGPSEDTGPMSFDAALQLQGGFYDDGTFDDRGVFQVDRLRGPQGEWWCLVEPNGFRASLEAHLLALAQDGAGVSFFWNVNAVMSLLRVDSGRVVANFDPLLDLEEAAHHASDLPFGDYPAAAAFALAERWTGIAITKAWFGRTKPTFVVRTPTR
jgi:hypothetical protein